MLSATSNRISGFELVVSNSRDFYWYHISDLEVGDFQVESRDE